MFSLRNFIISLLIGLVIFGLLAFLLLKFFLPKEFNKVDVIQTSLSSSLNKLDSTNVNDNIPDTTVSDDDTFEDKYAGDSFTIALGVVDEQTSLLLNVIVLKLDEQNEKLVYMPFSCQVPIKYSITGEDGEKYPVETNLGELYDVYGASSIKKRLSNLMGINIDYYMFLSKSAMTKAINKLGDVWFTVPYDVVKTETDDSGQQQITTLLTASTKAFSAQEAILALYDTGFAGVHEEFMTMHVDFLQSYISTLFTDFSVDEARNIIKNLIQNSSTDYTISSFDNSSELIFASNEFECVVCKFPQSLNEISGEAAYGLLLENYNQYR